MNWRIPVALVLCAVMAAAGEATPPLRVLAIGNSFSGNAMSQLPGLAKAAGKALETHNAFIEGGSMQMHWERHERSLADPQDASCRVSKLGALGEVLRAKPWDVVTIQQASGASPDPATYRPYAAQLLQLVRSTAPQAQVMVHETWAYRKDSTRFPAISPDHASMYRQLAAAYRGIAAELHLPLIPVGSAFFAADTDPVWGLRITDPAWNPKTAVHPSVPDNGRSLHKGWYWVQDKTGKYAVGYDGGHAGPNGSYLAGCVWFEVLFKTSVVGNAFRPAEIPADYARFLQETAHTAVAAMRP